MSFILIALVGYVIGYVISHIVWRILNIGELHKAATRYGAMTTKLWSSVTNFVTRYLKWYVALAILTTTEVEIVKEVYTLMGDLFWLIILTVIGISLGGVVFKIIKEALIHIGLEDELKRYNIAEALGGIRLSGILAGIAKWYIIVIFMAQGISKLPLETLTLFMNNLVTYIPNAIMGVMILIVALLISNFATQRIRKREIEFSEILALGVEIIIMFFAAVLALPKFGIENVSVLEDSFKILAVGVSIGLALALGLGLKDPISRIGSQIEQKNGK